MFTVDSDLMKKLDQKLDTDLIFISMLVLTSFIISFSCTFYLLDLCSIESDFFATVFSVLSFFLVFSGIKSCMKLILSFSVWKTCTTDSMARKWLTIEYLIVKVFMAPIFIFFSFLIIYFFGNDNLPKLFMFFVSIATSLALSALISLLFSLGVMSVVKDIHSRYTPMEDDDDVSFEKRADETLSFSTIKFHDSFSHDISLLNQVIQIVNELSIKQNIENKHSIETSLSRIQSSINMFDQLRENKKSETKENILHAIEKTHVLLEKEIENHEHSLILEIQKQCALIPEENHQ